MPLVAEAASRLRVKIDTPGLRDLVAEISWAKVSNVSAEDYPAWLASTTAHRLYDPKRRVTSSRRTKMPNASAPSTSKTSCCAPH